MDCGVYEIRNSINNHCYIGSSKSITKRCNAHYSKLRNGNHGNAYLQAAWNKYGNGAFVKTTLFLCNPKDRFEIEQQCINKLRPEYNIARIVGVAPGPLQGKGLESLRVAQKNIKGKMSPEEHKLWSEKLHKAKAEKRANETPKEKKARIERMSKPHRGRKKTAEHRRNISKAMKKKFAEKSPEEIIHLVQQMNSGKDRKLLVSTD